MKKEYIIINNMPHIHSVKHQLQNPSTRLDSKTTTKLKPTSKPGNNFLRLFKLFPLLTSGCKVVAMLAGSKINQRQHMIADHATIGTLFGHRKGRLTLAIQDDPHSSPFFVVELPILSSAFHKEMSGDVLRVALETETKLCRKNVTEEYVWAVYCNGRKVGYSIRRNQLSDDETRVLHTLRGVSMGAGVLPENEHAHEGDQITYLRARFERVVGSKDSEALYMINPDNSDGPELSIFFVRRR